MKFNFPQRLFPQGLPAWMAVLDKTLGSRQTLFKAPRGSERELKDTNAFCKNDFWTLTACAPSPPLPPGHVFRFICMVFASLFGLMFIYLLFTVFHASVVPVLFLFLLTNQANMSPQRVEPFSAMNKVDH